MHIKKKICVFKLLLENGMIWVTFPPKDAQQKSSCPVFFSIMVPVWPTVFPCLWTRYVCVCVCVSFLPHPSQIHFEILTPNVMV